MYSAWQELAGTCRSDACFPFLLNPLGQLDTRSLQPLAVHPSAQPWKCHSVRETKPFPEAAFACIHLYFLLAVPAPGCLEVRFRCESGLLRAVETRGAFADAAFSSRAWLEGAVGVWEGGDHLPEVDFHIDCPWEERILLESPRDRFTSLSEGPSHSQKIICPMW